MKLGPALRLLALVANIQMQQQQQHQDPSQLCTIAVASWTALLFFSVFF